MGLPDQSRSKKELSSKRPKSSIRSKAKSIWKDDYDLRLVELRRNLAFWTCAEWSRHQRWTLLRATWSSLVRRKRAFFKQDNAFDNSVFLLIVNTSNGKINFVRSKVSRETKFNCLSGETSLLDTSCSLSLMKYDCLEHLLSQTIRPTNEKRLTYLIVSKKMPKMRIECRMPLML